MSLLPEFSGVRLGRQQGAGETPLVVDTRVVVYIAGPADIDLKSTVYCESHKARVEPNNIPRMSFLHKLLFQRHEVFSRHGETHPIICRLLPESLILPERPSNLVVQKCHQGTLHHAVLVNASSTVLVGTLPGQFSPLTLYVQQ